MFNKWFNRRLDEKSLYWEPPKIDAKGNYSWKDPIELNSRWESKKRSIRYDLNGSELISNGMIWVSDEFIQVGGYIMRGDLYFQQDLLDPPIHKPYDVAEAGRSSQEYARLVIEIETVSLVYNVKIGLSKVWIR